ncbi:MAG: hypothetical protein HYX84_06995 [Chloroflexi bacterium]|nr:hypothetical protein [Chloroflexota bacterium]
MEERMRGFFKFVSAFALVSLLISTLAVPHVPTRGANVNDIFQLFPPESPRLLPAIPPWNFPEFFGEPALEPLPVSFNITEHPAWFDGVPVTIRPFPGPGRGDGGPDDDHADMWVFFYPDGTPVPQPPLLEAVPKNTFGPEIQVPDVAARFFSINWEVHAVIVPQGYVPGSLQSIVQLSDPNLVLENIQLNMFVTFPILPKEFNIEGLELNGVEISAGMFEGKLVKFIDYDVGDNEFDEKPVYLFRKPNGDFTGSPVLSSIPGQPHYNGMWEVVIVDVPEDYVADSLRSEDDVFASGYPMVGTRDAFFPVTSVNGKRTVFTDFMSILTGPDGKFRKDRFPVQVPSDVQPYHGDPGMSDVTFGFTNKFAFNEVEIPRIQRVLAVNDGDAALLAALGDEAVKGPLIIPPHVARQLLIQNSSGTLTHLRQADVDAMPLAEVIARGQALFERQIFEEDGAGPAFNAYSCAKCHGLPFNLGAEPTAGGAGVRFRNAMQPTDVGIRNSRNTPHVFGAGVKEQLGRELNASDNTTVKPFNWKGGASLRDFSAGPFKGEMGLEPVEIVAAIAGVSLEEAATLDLDKDGKVNEITVGDVTAVMAFMASLPRPFQVNKSDPAVIRGRQVFEQTGCTSCHTPRQTLQSTILEITNPETNEMIRIPLGEPEVEIFSDFKRHSMGPRLAEPGPQNGIPADVFRTQPLWGLADSGPYLHDGSANTIEEAIDRHGGEAQTVRDAFVGLPADEKTNLFAFLNSLRLPNRTQLELDFMNRMTSRDRNILAPVISSFLRPIQDPLLVAWIVNPPPEGTGRLSGNLTVQASVTSSNGIEQISLLVDSGTQIPMGINPVSGFFEAIVDTTELSEGDHMLTIQVSDRFGNRNAEGALRSVIRVDNIPDDSDTASGPLFQIPSNAPVKSFDISAIDVVITINRFGDNDPTGKMYVLDENIPAVRAQEAKSLPDRVSIGLRDDPIQPLVIRANIGDVVVINFTNRLNQGRAGIHFIGFPFNPATSAGSEVGLNNDTLVDKDATITYTFYIPDKPNMEGAYIFNSMGDVRESQAHGLFGVLNVEPKGSIYLNPINGQPLKSGWEAIIVDPGGKDFREDTIIYHEFGHEEFDLSDKDGRPIPQVVDMDGSSNYRPGSRAINYRSEPFFRRNEAQLDSGERTMPDESLDYGSYMNGDPATPIPRGYIGDPTKRRVAHAGSERFHLEHLHGGSIRWRFDPFVEPDQWGLPFSKKPSAQSLSQRLDSQEIGPGETYTMATEGAAGGLQAGAGEFLFHCHFAHHYIGGMWAFWRVFDTLQTANNGLFGNPALVELPDRVGTTPAAVNSLGLLGKALPSGRILTAGPTTNSTINIDEWVRSILPPQGVPVGYDASVWDWTGNMTEQGPLYLSEPETTLAWANYASPSPGQRLEIKFNPNNGRPAFPLLRPHLGKRPPFPPGRSGSPWLGEPDADHPDSLVPAGARRLEYTAVTMFTPITFNESGNITNPKGALLVLDEDKEDILAGRKPKEQLTIRANVGDGVDIIHYSEMDDSGPFAFSKANIHIHFVQFDTQASDGVISGLSYEQSIRAYTQEGPNGNGIRLAAPTSAGSTTITVDSAVTLQVNAFVGIGFGVPRNGPNGFEFAQIIAKDENTLTLDRPLQKDHPAGQFAGTEFVRYQWYADGESGTTFFHNHVFGIPGFGVALTGALIQEPEGSTWHDPVTGEPIRSGSQAIIRTNQQVAPGVPIQDFREFVLHFMGAITGLPHEMEGEGGEPGGVNMRMEPLDSRGRLQQNSDPSLLLSSVAHGDPATPLLRAYVGDLVAFRVLNSSGHDSGVFHLAGHRFRLERFDPREAPKDSVTIGISERYDLFMTAGSVGLQAGDYPYMNAMNEKMMDGAWGIFRVHDTFQSDLPPLIVPEPPEGPGFPQLTQTGGRPPAATEPDDIAGLKTKLERNGYQLPANMPVRTFDVVAIETRIDLSKDFKISDGRIYVLAEDKDAVLAGDELLEPLVLRANVGEIVRVNFTNNLTESRASFHIPELIKTTDSLGGALGFNNDSTVAPGETKTYWYVIDQRYEVPRSMPISDFGDPILGGASGLYGAFIIMPSGSTFHDPLTGVEKKSGVVVDVRNPSLPGGGFRDVALLFHEEDTKMNRDVMPYLIDVKGNRGINYRAEPFTERLEVDSAMSRVFTTENVSGHRDPRTTLIQVTVGDPVQLHVIGAFGNHPHVFAIDGHRFPFDVSRPNAMNLSARAFGTLDHIDAVLEGGAGGLLGAPGDYLYGDRRNPFLEAGLWGIMRVTPQSEATVLPLVNLVPGWNLVSRNVITGNITASEFLASISGKYDLVAAQDPANPAQYLTYSSSNVSNNLTVLDHTMGFWVYMREGAFLSPLGSLAGRTEIPLKAGWNLVGWPSSRTMPVGQALASIEGKFDMVLTYQANDATDPWKKFDVGAPAFANDLTLIQPLLGYWIRMKEPGTLVVNNP